MPFNFAQSLKTYSSYSMWLWSSVYHIHRVSNRRSIVLAIFHCRQIYNIGLNTEKSFSRLETENDVSYLIDFSGLMTIQSYSMTIILIYPSGIVSSALSVFGGPAGAIAATVLDLVSSIFGCFSEGSQEEPQVWFWISTSRALKKFSMLM